MTVIVIPVLYSKLSQKRTVATPSAVAVTIAARRTVISRPL